MFPRQAGHHGAVTIVEPMIPTLGPLPGGDRWVYEPKWDGWRAIVHVDADGGVQVHSRRGRNLTGTLPEMSDLGDAVGRAAVLDGELVAFDHGSISFYALSQRMATSRPSAVEAIQRRRPVVFIAFDLLALDGEDVTDRPWAERRGLLDALELASPAWHTSPAYFDVLLELPDICVSLGIEGVVAKRVDSRYTPGVRTRTWLKWKSPDWQRDHAPRRRPGARHGRRERVAALERAAFG